MVVGMVALVWLVVVAAASAQVWQVTSSADSGPGTLRAVIDSASDGDTVVIDSGVNPDLTSTGITLSVSLTIEGQGQGSTTITGDGKDSTFSLPSLGTSPVRPGNASDVAADPSLTIRGITLTGGGGTLGGALFVGSGNSATLDGVTAVGNTVAGGSGEGGAIAVFGTAQITNSTLTDNTAGVLGGGVYTQGQTVLDGDTLHGNRAGGDGGNIATSTSGTATLTDTIVDAGVAGRGDPNCVGSTVSTGHNLESTTQSECGLTAASGDLIGVNPLLDPLANYGGPTETLALMPNSPAIGHGDCSQAGLNGVDQRGLPRPGAGRSTCDIGAYEFQNASASVMCPATAVNQSTLCTATVTAPPGAAPAPSGPISLTSSGAGTFASGGTCTLAPTSAGATSARCSVAYTPTAAGSQTITLAYGGDSVYGALAVGTTLTITPLPPPTPVSLSVLCSPGTVAPGQSTTCRATVGGVTGGSPVRPTGSVVFTVTGASAVRGGGSCALAASGAQAACSVNFTLGHGASGTYDVTAAYGGDGNHLAATAPTSFAATPVAGKAANVTVLSGTVLIELPHSHSFSPLAIGRASPVSGVVGPIKGATVAVPMGSTVDTTKGKIQLATAASYTQPAHAPPPLQNAKLSAALFSIEQMTARQARAHLKHGKRLFGIPPTSFGLLTPRGATRRARCHRTGAPGKGVVRALSGSGKGLYRTVAANSITTVHSATWIVTDRCDATLTEVGRGRATVTPIHPTHKHQRPIVVTSGQGVLIKGRFL